mgnify:CR=1 FL=1
MAIIATEIFDFFIFLSNYLNSTTFNLLILLYLIKHLCQILKTRKGLLMFINNPFIVKKLREHRCYLALGNRKGIADEHGATGFVDPDRKLVDSSRRVSCRQIGIF